MGRLLEQQCEATAIAFMTLPAVIQAEGDPDARIVPSTRQLAAQQMVGKLSTEDRVALVGDLLSEDEAAGYTLEELDLFMGISQQVTGRQLVDTFLATVISSKLIDPELLAREAANLDAFESRLHPAA